MDLWDKVIDFHGHACCVLAVGYRAALAAEDLISPGGEERLFAVVSTADCSTDALQVVLSTTTGKRNLIVREQGKHVFMVSGERRAVRLTLREEVLGSGGDEFKSLMSAVANGVASDDEREKFYKLQAPLMEYILNAPLEELFNVEEADSERVNPGFLFS